MPRVLLVSIGGVLGSLARYGIAVAMPATSGSWSWATLLVNIVGALAIGVVAVRLARLPDWVGPFAITGVLGGFTTFSAIALESGSLIDSGQVLSALGYVAVTVAAGLVAVRVGAGIGRPR